MREMFRSRRILWAFLILGAMSSGCVYYNTFFNARQAFNEAEKYRKQSGQGTQVGYKTAIDKSLKVVEDHPNSKYYDDALFVLGVSYYYTQQYNKSERRLQELLTDFPKSKFIKEGTLYLAKAKLKTGATEEANALFEDIVQGKYDKQYRSEAAMALGEFHSEQKDQPNALRYYMAVRDSLGDDAQKLQAQRFIADGYFDEFKFAEALKGYLQVLGLKPDRPQKYHALYQAALCSYRLQRITVGLDYLAQLSKDPLFYDSLGAITLAVGEGHEAAGDIELAENVYQDVAMTSRNNFSVGEAYYRLGLIYQFDYDDADKAKKFYDQSVAAAGSSISGQDARSRSTDIGRLRALTDAGLDTIAVRMAQEGLDSLPPEDSVDVILEMKLPPPVDTTTVADSSQVKHPGLDIDPLALKDHPTADSLKAKDSTDVVRNDSLAGANGPKPPAPVDSLKAKDTAMAKLPILVMDSLTGEIRKVKDTLKSRDSVSGAKSDSAAIANGTKQPLPKDTIKVSDTALVKIPLRVMKDSSSAQPPPTVPSQEADSSSAGKPADTNAAKNAAPPAAKPPVQIDSSAQKILDSIAAKRPDTTTKSQPQGVSPQGDSVAPESLPLGGATVSKDSALSIGKDSLAARDTTNPKVRDSLLASDSTLQKRNDSLATGQGKDTTAAGNLNKTAGSTKPKTVKDSGLTRAQIFKRINDAAESQYSLAELYWFQLDKPDSAMKELTELLKVFPKSDRAPEAMIALSQMYRDYKADTAGADSLLHSVLTNYPRSDYVPEALEALGLQGTPADTGYAEYYLRKAESFLFDQKNPDSARYYYRYVARQFPRSRVRDQAAFSAIWVVENYKSPGDSSIYYAYKHLANAFPGSPYAAAASKRITYVAPPPIPKPTSQKEKGPANRTDSILAQGKNMVTELTAADTAPTYIDPRQAAFVGPKKEELILIELQPVQTAIEFTYPTEAYDLDGNQFILYFQVLLDATGKVIDLVLKVPTSSDQLNRNAQLTVGSMTFDPLDVSKQLQQKAINMILPEEQTDRRGRWYVYKYTVSKPGFYAK